MKYRLILLLACLISVPSLAQLKAPQTTVRDTIFIVGTFYNDYTLSFEDFPCRYIEESATSFIAAGENYMKGTNAEKTTELSGNGEIKCIDYPYAKVNNKAARVRLIESDEKCEDPDIVVLTLDDYQFVGYRIDVFRRSMKQLPEQYQSLMKTFIKAWVSDEPFANLESVFSEEEVKLLSDLSAILLQ